MKKAPSSPEYHPDSTGNKYFIVPNPLFQADNSQAPEINESGIILHGRATFFSSPQNMDNKNAPACSDYSSQIFSWMF